MRDFRWKRLLCKAFQSQGKTSASFAVVSRGLKGLQLSLTLAKDYLSDSEKSFVAEFCEFLSPVH
jgi:hypothetical protein